MKCDPAWAASIRERDAFAAVPYAMREADEAPRPRLEPGDFYWEGDLLVLTAQYHLRRGTCCGNACRHCPYGRVNVPR